ncbi:hypothetical protein DMENIID0001_015960 [Sergentomyia squamirostris]
MLGKSERSCEDSPEKCQNWQRAILLNNHGDKLSKSSNWRVIKASQRTLCQHSNCQRMSSDYVRLEDDSVEIRDCELENSRIFSKQKRKM